jgi:hypothetical protein
MLQTLMCYSKVHGLSDGNRDFGKKYPNKKMSHGAIYANRINL